jgi:3-oxoacyl-[acyl-carrier-protein] synthase II
VVTGIGAVSPNGIGTDAFWSATRAGTSGVSRIEQFDVSDYPTRIAGQVRDFRPENYLSDREVKHLPRAVSLGLAAATEALQDARIDTPALDLEQRQDFGVVIGSGGVGWEFTERQFREYYFGNPKSVSLYTIPSSTPGSISSELSMKFDLRGPSHVISTGCTSSSDALGHAFSLIRYGRVGRVLTGGTDAPLAPGILRGFCLMKIMTPSWNDQPERGSRPFAKDRDGFVIAEGAWMFVLEALDSAVERGRPIYGELLGYGATCEAFHRVRLNEDGAEPARAMNLGSRATSIPASSLKSMIGHPQGACGAAGVAASLLAMRDGFAPPTINRDDPDPQCDLDVVPLRGREAEIDAILCNCIGFGSKNSALVFVKLDENAARAVDAV